MLVRDRTYSYPPIRLRLSTACGRTCIIDSSCYNIIQHVDLCINSLFALFALNRFILPLLNFIQSGFLLLEAMSAKIYFLNLV